MALTDALPGVSLTLSNQPLVENPAGSGERRTYELTFVNKSAADAFVTSCEWMQGGVTANPIVPANYKVAVGDGFTLRKVLKPGESIRSLASAANAIHVTVDQVYAEPV
ncbi:hypothetical protein [Shinella zoogloeoides]|uniref:hypothetical protein n=1 Tax=Shinella zoogloeoides TaxID=352475 RepID=UPI001F5862E7|nr:hypothetical protein [Shinella zoogloeoides]